MEKSFYTKFALSLVALIASAVLTFGQTNPTPTEKKFSNQQVVDILNMSLELNGAVTLEDLNKGNLFVGDVMRYPLQDGSTLAFPVALGDNPWTLGIKALEYQQKNPGNPIVKPEQEKPVTDSEAGVSPTGAPAKKPWWIVWAAIAIGVLWLIFDTVRKVRNSRKKEKAVKADEPALATQQFLPLVPGGVSDAQGPAYMQQVAARKRLTIVGPTENVLLSTKEGKKIKMDFVGCQDEREFKNEPFRRALAVRNQGDTPQYAYYQQICGNDATILNPDDITVVVCENQPEELIQANVAVGTPMQQTSQPVAQQQPVTTPVTTDPVEIKSTFLRLAEIVDSEMKDGKEAYFHAEKGEIHLSLSEKKFSVNGHSPKELKDQPALEEKN